MYWVTKSPKIISGTTISALLFAVVFLCSSVAADSLEGAMAAYNQGDYKTAIDLLTPLAQQGNPTAQATLGEIYVLGLGVPKNPKKGGRLFLSAAERGYASAQTILGTLYADGVGFTQNFQAARMWYRAASEQGDLTARRNLGLMFARGLGTQVNLPVAYMWFELAEGIGNLDAIVRLMTPEEIEIANQLVGECKKNNFRNCGE